MISNVAPFPSDVARTSPPWARAISRTIASPRPVPSVRPVTKGSNRRSQMLSGIPVPVSCTRKLTQPSRLSASTFTVPPEGVFWIALRMRLSSARCICSASNAGDGGVAPPSAVSNSTPLVAANSRCGSMVPWRNVARLVGAGFTFFCEVIAKRSRSRTSRRPTCSKIAVRADQRRSSSPARAFSAFRRIAAIGLRISCARPAVRRPTAASLSAEVARRRSSAKRTPREFSASTSRSSSRSPVLGNAGRSAWPA
jgi:hypothetical protein